MSWIILIIVGGIIGWLAGLITGTSQSLLVNILAGIIGSLLGKWIFADLLNIGSAGVAGSLSFWGVFWGVLGAIILLSIVRAFRA